MPTRWDATRRMEEEFDDVGVPPQDNKAPLQGNQVPLQHQAPAIPPKKY